MTISVRLPLVAALFGAGLALAACSSHRATGPVIPPRAAVNGAYGCYRVDAYYYNAGTDTARWRIGRCSDYVAVTNPSRADSIELLNFSISSDDYVRRIDYRPAYFAYDTTTGIAIESYQDRPADTMYVAPGEIQIHFPAFDFTGDGRIDSLRITYLMISQ